MMQGYKGNSISTLQSNNGRGTTNGGPSPGRLAHMGVWHHICCHPNPLTQSILLLRLLSTLLQLPHPITPDPEKSEHESKQKCYFKIKVNAYNRVGVYVCLQEADGLLSDNSG